MDATGALMAVDVGTVRTGVAISDPGRTVAVPVATLAHPPAGPGKSAGGSPAPSVVRGVVDLAAEHGATGVVVGWPLGLDGGEGAAGRSARAFAEALARTCDLPVRLVDERFTSTTANTMLREHARPGARSGRKRRAVVDQTAALVLLQHVLEAARSGTDLGTAVTPTAGVA